MPNYGVIDLGSNSIRLVIYEVKDDRKRIYTNHDFRSLLNDKVMAGLSAYVQNGVFTQAGVARAASVLKGHAKRSKYFQCKRIDVFATAVLRNCENSAEAISAVEEACAMRINLLSARDEAHLGFRGATCDREIERGTLMDIGGGSTELTRIENGTDSHDTSIPQGSLSSYARFVKCVFPTQEEADFIAGAFRAAVAALPDSESFRAERFYGVGGSVRAAAKMLAAANGVLGDEAGAAENADRRTNLAALGGGTNSDRAGGNKPSDFSAPSNGAGERPKEISPQTLAALITLLHRDPQAFSHLAAKAVPERIHTLVPGCVIAQAALAELGAKTLEICKYGVREGYLIERMLQ